MQVVAQNRRQSPVELLCVSDDARSCVEDTLKLVCPESRLTVRWLLASRPLLVLVSCCSDGGRVLQAADAAYEKQR